MRILTLILLSLFVSASVVLAQAPEKPVVAVLNFKYSARNSEIVQYVTGVQNQVESGVLATGRFVVVERGAIDQLQGEIQTQEVLSEAQVAELGRTLGAKYVFLGSLDQASTEPVFRETDGQRKRVGFKATIVFQLKLVDVESTQIIASEQVSTGQTGLFGYRETEGAAITDAIGTISGQVELFIAKNLPVIIDIIQITQTDKKGREAVLLEILAGSDAGLKDRDRIEVVAITEREIRGRKIETRTPIGELRVEQVTGPETAICKVMKGGDVILQKFNAGEDIRCVFAGLNKSLFGR